MEVLHDQQCNRLGYNYCRTLIKDHNSFYRAIAYLLLLNIKKYQKDVFQSQLHTFNSSNYLSNGFPFQLKTKLLTLFKQVRSISNNHDKLSFQPYLIYHLNKKNNQDIVLILLARNYILKMIKHFFYKQNQSIINLYSQPNESIINGCQKILPFHIVGQSSNSCQHNFCIGIQIKQYTFKILYKDKIACQKCIQIQKAIIEKQKYSLRGPGSSHLSINTKNCIKCNNKVDGIGNICPWCKKEIWMQQIVNKPSSKIFKSKWAEDMLPFHRDYQLLDLQKPYQQAFKDKISKTAPFYPYIQGGRKYSITPNDKFQRRSIFTNAAKQTFMQHQYPFTQHRNLRKNEQQMYQKGIYQQNKDQLLPLKSMDKKTIKKQGLNISKRFDSKQKNQIQKQLQKYRAKERLKTQTDNRYDYKNKRQCKECKKRTDMSYPYCSTQCQIKALKAIISIYQRSNIIDRKKLRHQLQRHMNQRLSFKCDL